MKVIMKLVEICALCLLTSLSAFSQETIQPSDKSVATYEIKITSESTEDIKPKTEKTAVAPAKRQSANQNSWKGFYVGGNVGIASTKNSLVTSTENCGGYNGGTCYFQILNVPLANQTATQQTESKGFIGGVQSGYNFQVKNFVTGVEADFNSDRHKKSVSNSQTYTLVGTFQFTQSIKRDWLMTVRPRAGYAVKRALIYGTGGLAVTNLNYQMNFTDSFNAKANNTINKTKAGWTAGVGAEFRVSDKWSVKGEYLYTNFKATGSSNNIVDPGQNLVFVNQILNNDVKLESHNFRFGFNYRF